MDICSVSCTSTRWHCLSCQISTGHLYSCSAKLRNATVAKWNITFNISFFGLSFSEMQEKCKKSFPLSGFALSQPLSFRPIVSWEVFQEERLFCAPLSVFVRRRQNWINIFTSLFCYCRKLEVQLQVLQFI